MRWNMKKYKYVAYNTITGELIASTHRIKTQGKGWVFSSKHPQIAGFRKEQGR
jgi:hypothetical protein